MSIKSYYDINFVKKISNDIKKLYAEFNSEAFILDMESILDEQSYSERMIIISEGLHKYFPNYKTTLELFTKMLGPKLSSMKYMYDNMEYAPFGKYIEKFAPDNEVYLEETFYYIYELTQRYTGEFAMRPLLVKYPNECIGKIKIWMNDSSDCVRRMCSECMRVAIPWSSKIKFALEHFNDYSEILIKLSTDECEYVRRSVANNLNELCKADLDKAKTLIEELKEIDNKYIPSLIKHGTRWARKKGIL